MASRAVPSWASGFSHYAVIHIGCIECGTDSGIVGIFTSFNHATLIAEKYSLKLEWMGRGQNKFEVFPVDINKINVDFYADTKTKIRSKDPQQLRLVESQIKIIDEMLTDMSNVINDNQ